MRGARYTCGRPASADRAQQFPGSGGRDDRVAIGWHSKSNPDTTDNVINGQIWSVCGNFCDGFEGAAEAAVLRRTVGANSFAIKAAPIANEFAPTDPGYQGAASSSQRATRASVMRCSGIAPERFSDGIS